MTRTSIIVVSGPTASGKSSYSLALAKELNGEIVALDSVQVFRGMDIGSAKVRGADQEGIPHHLIDIRNPNEPFNVATYVREADSAIASIVGRGKVPIIVGGTTLYLTALLHGLVDIPEPSGELRAAIRSESTEALYAKLLESDPQRAAQLHRNDRVRIERAVESFLVTGSPASMKTDEHRFSVLRYNALTIVLMPTRETLYDRINRRAQEMIREGILEETKTIVEKYGDDIAPLRTLGYAQALQVLQGELSEVKLEEEIALHTRHFAKRQMTYWRNEPKKRGWQVFPQQPPQELRQVQRNDFEVELLPPQEAADRFSKRSRNYSDVKVEVTFAAFKQ